MKNTLTNFLCLCLLTGLVACSQQDNSNESMNNEGQAKEPVAPVMEEQAVVEEAPAPQPALPVVGNPDHEAMLASDDPQLAANKRLVYDFWRTLVDAHDYEAARQYADPIYIQHNPIADTGYEGVAAYFSSQGEPLPIPDMVQRPMVALLAERDLVVTVWAREAERPNAPGQMYSYATFDMYRIADNKIVEHWDHGTLPEGMTPRNYVPPVENPDHGKSLASDDPMLSANKLLVYDMWRTLLDGQQVEEAPKYLSEGYIQHNPMANTGLSGFLAFFRAFAQPREVPEKVLNFIDIVAEGDKVVMATVVNYLDSNGDPYSTTWFDMYVVEGDKLVEHWDSANFQMPQRAPAAE